MMPPHDPRALPARPPSEVEWEDLLVRVEIAPRALRLAVDDAPAGHPAVRQALREGVRSETFLQRTAEAMVEGTEAPDGAGVEDADGDAPALLARYESLRRRTFAMMQRRGLGVWEWTARGGAYDGVTAYQLLLSAAQTDGALLHAIRRAGRGEAGA